METPATRGLRAAGIAFELHSYTHDPRSRTARDQGYGLEAAAALGVEADRVFKTLVALVDGRVAIGIVPVTGRLDLTALATALGGRRAELAPAALAERRTGYVVGGISPVGQKHGHPTVLDETALLWDTVFVSGGRRGVDLELAPTDLVSVTAALVRAIAR